MPPASRSLSFSRYLGHWRSSHLSTTPPGIGASCLALDIAHAAPLYRTQIQRELASHPHRSNKKPHELIESETCRSDCVWYWTLRIIRLFRLTLTCNDVVNHLSSPVNHQPSIVIRGLENSLDLIVDLTKNLSLAPNHQGIHRPLPSIQPFTTSPLPTSPPKATTLATATPP